MREKRRMRLHVIAALAVLWSIVPLRAAPAPATGPAPAPAPATAAASARAPAPKAETQALIERARRPLEQVELSERQKAQVEKILRQAGAELEGMRQKLESMTPRGRAEQMREFFQGLRAEIAFVLTPEQREAMRQRLEPMRDLSLPPPGALAERIFAALPELNLSGEQAQRLKTFFEDLRPRVDALRQQMAAGEADARERAVELAQEVRDELMEILSPEQQQKLRRLLSAGAAGVGEAGEAAAGAGERAGRPEPGGKRPDGMMSDTTMMSGEDNMMSMEGAARGEKPGAPAQAEKTGPAGPAVGEAAPDFTLMKLEGGQAMLSSMKGRVIVLVFGSYSAPAFRQRAAALEKLRGETAARATFFIVYTREAHPAGEWEVARNKQDGISVEQPRTLEARKTLAQTAREKLNLRTPILLDTLGNDTAQSYGAGMNSAIVIARDGTIAARQQWFEPLALKRAIDAATAPAAAVAPAAAASRPARP